MLLKIIEHWSIETAQRAALFMLFSSSYSKECNLQKTRKKLKQVYAIKSARYLVKVKPKWKSCCSKIKRSEIECMKSEHLKSSLDGSSEMFALFTVMCAIKISAPLSNMTHLNHSRLLHARECWGRENRANLISF